MAEKGQLKFPVTPNVMSTTACTAKQRMKRKTEVEKSMTKEFG